MIKIIINADDFGLTESCSLAIICAFKQGYISSTTMCANGYYFDKALELAKENDLIRKIGIHINLTEGVPLTSKIKEDTMFCCNEEFHGKINRYKPLSFKQKVAVYDEVKAQIENMKKAGLTITHADSHHHIHTSIFIAPTIFKVLKLYNIKKVRIHRNIGHINVIKKIYKKLFNLWLKINKFIVADYFGDINDCKKINIKGKTKVLEIMVHPDYNKNDVLIDRVDFVDAPKGEKLGQVLESMTKEALCSYFEI